MNKITKSTIYSAAGLILSFAILDTAFAGPMYLKKLKQSVPDAKTRELMIEICVKAPDCYLVNEAQQIKLISIGQLKELKQKVEKTPFRYNNKTILK